MMNTLFASLVMHGQAWQAGSCPARNQLKYHMLVLVLYSAVLIISFDLAKTFGLGPPGYANLLFRFTSGDKFVIWI